MPDYRVPAKYIFTGTITIKNASSAAEAHEWAEKHVGLVIGGDIHTTLSDDEVDWDFTIHPEKRIGKPVIIK